MIVTLGVEEELQVVDAHTRALVPHDFDLAQKTMLGAPGGITSELHKCAIELQTPVDSHPDQTVTGLSILRTVARKQAALQGQQLLAAGLHPFSQWQGQPVHDDAERYPHYAHVVREYGEIARSAMSFGLHVHLGLPCPELRIPVMNALRGVLPEVLALSVNSPFHEGRDTGLASWRHSLLGRYPRMGIPEAWADEAAYTGHVARLRRVGILEPDQGMWDDLRLHQRYGTLEVRICDSIYSLNRIWLIVALLQCEAVTLIAEAAAGTLPGPEARAFIEENKWRARRHGLAAALIDWRRDEAVPTAIRYERWLARLQPAAMTLGLWPRLERAMEAALHEGTAAEQQRQWHRNAGSFESLVARLIEASSQSWVPPSANRTDHREISDPPALGTPERRPWPASSAHLRTGRALSGAAAPAARDVGAVDPGRPLSD